MTTPTLTEARRALLELQNMSTAHGEPERRLAVIAAYLDSLVPLNIENNGLLVVNVGRPVECNDIVQPGDSQERDDFAVRLDNRLKLDRSIDDALRAADGEYE